MVLVVENSLDVVVAQHCVLERRVLASAKQR
jgi:hypothetical protein